MVSAFFGIPTGKLSEGRNVGIEVKSHEHTTASVAETEERKR
jgi:hypothetical protein